MTKLSNHFMENDPERLLLNQGGRVSNLHKLSKLKHMEKNQMGSGLAGPGVEHVEKQQKTESQRLLNTPAQLNIPLRRWAKIRAYQTGWPAETGVLGLPRQGRGSMPAIARMIEQGTDAHQEAGQAILDKGTEYTDAAKERWDQLMELLNQYE